MSDRFSAGFSWLDKLGIAASAGYRRVFCQTFIGGIVPPFVLNYGLLNQQLQPHPDYFSTLLFKRLVGSAALAAQQSLHSPPDSFLRAYAFCTSETPSVSLPNEFVQEGSVTVLWLSLHSADGLTVSLTFDLLASDSQLQARLSALTPRLDFALSPNSTAGHWPTDVTAEGIRLNGFDIGLLPGGIVPLMPPRVVSDGSQPLTIAPLTYGFAVFPAAAAPACGYKLAAEKEAKQAKHTPRHMHHKQRA